MKKLYFLCFVFALCGCLVANATSFPDKAYDDLLVLELEGSDADLSPLYAFVDKYADVIKDGKAPVYVTSYSNTLPVSKTNSKNAAECAKSVKDALVKKGVPEKYIVTEGLSGRYDEAYPVVIVRIGIPEGYGKGGSKYTPRAGQSNQTVVKSEIINIVQAEDVKVKRVREPREGSEFNLRTNLLYLAAITLNAGVEYRFSQYSSIMINGGWAHWNWNDGYRTYRIWYVAPEYRRYLGMERRWYVGLQAQYGQLDYMFDETGRQGDFYGGSVTGGYVLPIGKKLDLDFSLGLGLTHYKYDKYEWQNMAPVNKDYRVVTEKDCKFNLWGPNSVGVSLIWHFTR